MVIIVGVVGMTFDVGKVLKHGNECENELYGLSYYGGIVNRTAIQCKSIAIWLCLGQ